MQGCTRLSDLNEEPVTEATNVSQQLSKLSLLPATVQIAFNTHPVRISAARGLTQPHGTVGGIRLSITNELYWLHMCAQQTCL